jgi:tripartite-type tricarboxylate transporter receptor subunit TctC
MRKSHAKPSIYSLFVRIEQGTLLTKEIFPMNANPATLKRRKLLQTSASLLLPLKLARAQSAWPDRPIKLIVPSAAGGAPDAICRILGTELATRLKTPVVIENRPGAGGAIGMQEVARGAPDGYTLGYANVVTLAINQALYKKLSYDADSQFASVALLGYVQNALIINTKLPPKTVKELVAYAKSRPGKLTMGSAGNGTTGHLGGELFKSMTQTFITHVPYRGSPQALQDLIGGQIDLMFDNLSSCLPHIKAGRVRALAVSASQRSPQLTEVPTMIEAGVPGYDTTAWGGIVAPAGTPSELVRRLNSEINAVLGMPSVFERYRQLAFETNISGPDRLFERARRERPIWADIVKRSGASID